VNFSVEYRTEVIHDVVSLSHANQSLDLGLYLDLPTCISAYSWSNVYHSARGSVALLYKRCDLNRKLEIFDPL